MIIQNSTLNSSASRRYQYTSSFYEERSVWDNATGESQTAISMQTAYASESSASMNSSPVAAENIGAEKSSLINCQQEMQTLLESFQTSRSYRMSRLEEQIKDIQKIQQESLNHLLRMLFRSSREKLSNSLGVIDRTNTPAELSANNSVTLAAEDMGQVLGTGGSYKSFYYCAERETTCFETSGTAITADGRELSFNISLEMSRSFTAMASEQIDFGQPRLCDPLVINLNSNVASVSDQKFFFDLDADGTAEEISMLHSSSGYLALDKNNDGAINDGSELFGTSSGNGFYDLLQYDKDGNGWIDEADEIFNKLRIWSMDEQGNSTLVNLKEAGVGAIHLGYEDTEFSLKNTQNMTNAIIRATGMFLYEDGEVGTVQQMDLAV